MKRKEHAVFIAIFSLLAVVLFWKVVLLRQTFIRGDYLQQFFPWSMFYAQSIKNFILPLWIRYVQSGFPLFAEGQTGMLYPLNLAMFFFLPFRVAYNYSFILHFFLAGFFTYLLSRKLGADLWGGLVSAIMICFGSVYAGLFVNIAALRSLAWLPAVFLLYELYMEKGSRGYVLIIGALAGMQLLAGSFQMTFYAFGFYLLYFFYRSRLEKKSFLSFVLDAATVLFIAALISLPQTVSTFQLAELSNRPSRTLGFALWDSFSPFTFLGCFTPYVAGIFSFSRGAVLSSTNILYVGITGLFLASFAIWLSGKSVKLRPFVLLLGVSLFFALGKYNPLYVLLLDFFKFYSFRVPSRFIYFSIFSLSILGGAGFTAFLRWKEMVPSVIYRTFLVILPLVVAVALALMVAFTYFGPVILEKAEDYVESSVFGETHHRYDLDTYLEKTREVYDLAREELSFRNAKLGLSLVLILFAWGGLVWIRRPEKGKKQLIYLKSTCIVLFLCLELFTFRSLVKMFPDTDSFSYGEPEEKRIFSVLENDKTLFRILPFSRYRETPEWLRPSMNARYGIDSAALYTPLINRDYFMAMKGLGNIDDAMGIYPPSGKELYEKIDLLRWLNVKYVISVEKLKHRSLDLINKENDIYLYRLDGSIPRFSFSGSLEKAEPLDAEIEVKKYRSGYAEALVNNGKEGFLVFSEKNYPGWKAYVDGNEAVIHKFSRVLQAVKIAPGEHSVVFSYRPDHSFTLIAMGCLVFVAALAAGFFMISSKREV